MAMSNIGKIAAFSESKIYYKWTQVNFCLFSNNSKPFQAPFYSHQEIKYNSHI